MNQISNKNLIYHNIALEINLNSNRKEQITHINKIHQLSPYIGKIRPELAQYLIKNYCPINSTVWDPFCGSGTIPFESWISGHCVYATDLNLYAVVLTLGKLNPPPSLNIALEKIKHYNETVVNEVNNFDRSCLPIWLFDFFHPQTLIETVVWTRLLHKNEEWYLLSCLMGILHHQRPGFLSFPCSHGAPYLRNKKYSRELFPEMYEYRNVFIRLESKIKRSLKGYEYLNFKLKREIYLQNSFEDLPGGPRINTIITSPPYMKALTYARDNRLRLWFLGFDDWQKLDKAISPNKMDFINLMEKSFVSWSKYQFQGDTCILIIGDMIIEKEPQLNLKEFIIRLAETNNYRLKEIFQDPIPEARKIVKGNDRIKSEDICIFEKM